ncbi:MAG: reverse gyrase, partial [Candidatus Hecatellales archaeon]
PTGIGKTTFGVAAALFLGGKAYIMLPTSILVSQVEKLARRLGGEGILAYHTSLSEKQRKEVKEKIRHGEFSLLITTSMFLSKNFDLLKGQTFSFIFVDDVDSMLKRAKNVDKVLMLLGFREEEIEEAMKASSTSSFQQPSRRVGLLVVSSATAKPKTRRVRLFRRLLGFEVGMPLGGLRNVEDVVVFPRGSLVEEAVRLVKRFGRGGLLFIPSDLGREKIGEYVSALREAGIEAESYEELNEKLIERFERGEVQVLVGISSAKNPLARGLDLPQSVRYAVFAGVPKNRIPLDFDRLTIPQCLAVIVAVKPFLEAARANRYLWELRRNLTADPSKSKRAEALLAEVRSFLAEALSNPEVVERIQKAPNVWLERKAEGFEIVIADAAGYLQASGRTSRLYAGGVSKGASFLLVDNEKAFNDLRRRLSWFLEEIEFKRFEEVNLESLFEAVDRDRRKIGELKKGKISEEEKKLVRSVMVVVESPNKARTIASFFGRPARRRVGSLTVYEVNAENLVVNIVATGGHIFDLTVDRGFHGVEVDEHVIPVFETIKKCNQCGEQFTGSFCPRCKSQDYLDKMAVVEALREIAKEVDEVILATDPDTEGEKIAYDVASILRCFNEKIRRAEFHEVTRRAFTEALRNPRSLNIQLVEGQTVRRVADRWVGFELSQHLWKVFDNVRLSAGRVQTPVLGWVIERAEEAKRRVGLLKLRGEEVEIKLNIPDLEEAKRLYEEAETFTVEVLGERVETVSPPPPFSTDAMIREASRLLGFDATLTMRLAQELFEAGLITYHRTDSVRVSTAGMTVAQRYMAENGLESLFKARKWSEAGAHECIRPTRPLDAEQVRLMLYSGALRGKLTGKHLRLYDLIFRRFMASQAVEAEVRRKTVKIRVGGFEEDRELTAGLVEEGFYRFLKVKLEDLPEGTFKIVGKELKLAPSKVYYTQGTLIQAMKERGIGRPSTYAITVNRLLEHKYLVERKRYLFPTRLGVKVYAYLSSHFGDLVSEEFTRRLEELMDKVERGEADYNESLLNLYHDLKGRIPG